MAVEIYDWYDLDEIRNNLGDNYILMNDLTKDTAGYEELVNTTDGWNPIGDDTNPFTGTFDGSGYTISDLYINRSDEDDIGLFGYTDGSTIENVGLEDVDVSGTHNVGGLVGINNDSTVSNSYSTGDVSGGGHFVGGLLGRNQDSSTVSNSYSTGTVNGDARVGGLVGYSRDSSTVSNSYSTGTVNGNDDLGSLVGRIYNADGETDEILYSYANSDINPDLDLIGSTSIDGTLDTTGSSLKTTAEMTSYSTFDDGGWDITTVEPGETDDNYTWNIVDGHTEPFLSFEENPLEVDYIVAEDVTETVGVENEITVTAYYEDDEPFVGEEISVDEDDGLTGIDIGDVQTTDENGEAFFTFNEEDVGEYIVEFSAEDETITDTSTVTVDYGEIHDWHDLDNVRNNLDGVYILMNDLDENTDGYDELVDTEDGWNPIGESSNPFTGSFDGQGYVISDLYIDRSDEDEIGLFGYADGATIEKIGLEDVDVSGDRRVGGLVGYNRDSTVSNSYSTGTVSGDSNVGGLVGRNRNAEVSNSYSTGNVSGSVSVGGLVGYNWDSTVSNSYATGTVSGDNHVGGLVGRVYNNEGETDEILYSYANSDINPDLDLIGSTSIDGTLDTTGSSLKTTAEMTDYPDYPDAYEGWDFVE